jgi:hypothetical protein
MNLSLPVNISLDPSLFFLFPLNSYSKGISEVYMPAQAFQIQTIRRCQ